MITVKPLSKDFKVKIEHENESVTFTFHQLDYRTKSNITSSVLTVKDGVPAIDSALQVYFNLKHGLKGIEGLKYVDGSEYKLEFEDKTKACLTDECTDQLLATEVSENLIFAVNELASSVLPKEIMHPLTGKKIEGVTIVSGDNTKK